MNQISNDDILSWGSRNALVRQIVYRGDQWVIVVLNYKGKTCLAIRWLYQGSKGFPSTFGKESWCILPDQLYHAILDALTLRPSDKKEIMQILNL